MQDCKHINEESSKQPSCLPCVVLLSISLVGCWSIYYGYFHNCEVPFKTSAARQAALSTDALQLSELVSCCSVVFKTLVITEHMGTTHIQITLILPLIAMQCISLTRSDCLSSKNQNLSYATPWPCFRVLLLQSDQKEQRVVIFRMATYHCLYKY